MSDEGGNGDEQDIPEVDPNQLEGVELAKKFTIGDELRIDIGGVTVTTVVKGIHVDD